jgi:methyl-accepting chemotaxis protein
LVASYTRSGEPKGIATNGDEKSEIVAVSRDVVDGGERLGSVRMEARLEGVIAHTKHYAGIAAAARGVAILLAFWLSSLLQGFIGRPISHLGNLMAGVAAKHDYTLRAPSVRRDELGGLYNGFNHMRRRFSRTMPR